MIYGMEERCVMMEKRDAGSRGGSRRFQMSIGKSDPKGHRPVDSNK